MAQGPNSNHQKVSELLQEIFDLWTDISTDDEDIKARLKLHKEISPEFEYNKEWFVTTKGGDMFFKDTVGDLELPALSRKFTSEKRSLSPLGDILITEPVSDVVMHGIFPEQRQMNIQHIIN